MENPSQNPETHAARSTSLNTRISTRVDNKLVNHHMPEGDIQLILSELRSTKEKMNKLEEQNKYLLEMVNQINRNLAPGININQQFPMKNRVESIVSRSKKSKAPYYEEDMENISNSQSEPERMMTPQLGNLVSLNRLNNNFN